MSGLGVVCFISNFSYLADPSYVVMRRRLLSEFDRVWIDCMNGDSRETGKLTPDGLPDPSVFSTERDREGIRLGTAIGLLARTGAEPGESAVQYRDFWGVSKQSDLTDALTNGDRHLYHVATPGPANRHSLRPLDVSDAYLSWPRVVELARVAPISGLQEMRHSALIDIDRDALAERMERYFDPRTSLQQLGTIHRGFALRAGGFVPEAARERLLAAGKFEESALRRYALLPFDNRYCYWSPRPPLWNRARPELAAQVREDNRFFMARPLAERPRENLPATVTRLLPDYHLLRPNVVAIPMRLGSSSSDQGAAQQALIEESEQATVANLSAPATIYLDTVLEESDPEVLWMHAVAVIASGQYLRENSHGVRQDFPRVPLPATGDVLLASARLGDQAASLLDSEEPVDAVTTGAIRRELRLIGVITTAGRRQLDPSAGDLAITAGWGHTGQGGVTMPGRGRAVERPYTGLELASFREGLADLDMTMDELLACLGETCYDIYLNDVAYWRCIPARVWKYTIGGYQVMKKWLSYRERALLGRDLKSEEARYVTEMTRRIAAILLLEPALDANYERVKADPYAWPGTT